MMRWKISRNMLKLAQRRVGVGAADKILLSSSTVILCFGTLNGVSVHVYA